MTLYPICLYACMQSANAKCPINVLYPVNYFQSVEELSFNMRPPAKWVCVAKTLYCDERNWEALRGQGAKQIANVKVETV